MVTLTCLVNILRRPTDWGCPSHLQPQSPTPTLYVLLSWPSCIEIKQQCVCVCVCVKTVRALHPYASSFRSALMHKLGHNITVTTRCLFYDSLRCTGLEWTSAAQWFKIDAFWQCAKRIGRRDNWKHKVKYIKTLPGNKMVFVSLYKNVRTSSRTARTSLCFQFPL